MDGCGAYLSHLLVIYSRGEDAVPTTISRSRIWTKLYYYIS